MGTILQNEADLTKEIEERISSAMRLYFALTKSFIGSKQENKDDGI